MGFKIFDFCSVNKTKKYDKYNLTKNFPAKLTHSSFLRIQHFILWHLFKKRPSGQTPEGLLLHEGEAMMRFEVVQTAVSPPSEEGTAAAASIVPAAGAGAVVAAAGVPA